MAKELLKEAIADAKAVREVALENAKMALEEAFDSKIKSMLSAKLAEDVLGSEAGDTYTEMLDKERAKQLSSQISLGIAEALVNQFSNRVKK